LRPFPDLRVEELEARTVPASLTWTGAGGNTNWSNPGNWGGVVPQDGDSLSFPAGLQANVRTANNDFIGATFNSITISDSNYTITGKAITLGQVSVSGSGNISVSAFSANDKINLNIVLGAAAGSKQFFTIGSGADLTINGQISGNTGSTLTKEQPGVLILTGNNAGFTGPIFIDNNSGALEITNPNALGDTLSGTTVGTNSSLEVSNVATTIFEPITINGPGVSNLGALRNIAGTNSWGGPVIVDSDATFGADNGSVIQINNVVSDTSSGHNVTKEGQGEVQFNAANTYRGTTTINDGYLTIGNANALGTADKTKPTGTIVNQTLTKAGQLRLGDAAGSGFTVLNENLILNGGGINGNGALFNSLGNNNWAGPVNLGSNVSSVTFASIGAAAGTNINDLIVSGIVTNTNNFTFHKVAPGRVILNNSNTYFVSEFVSFFTTFVDQGILNIRDSHGLGTPSTTGGFATVANGATLQLEVEAATTTPRLGYNQATGSASGRDLWDDSVTHDPNKLKIGTLVYLQGLGAGNLGALHSLSGINTYAGLITLNGDAAIGVAIDGRPGHPSPTSGYFTDDYSLSVINGISEALPGSSLIKRDLGHLILTSNALYTGAPYSGPTQIQQGWITITDPQALGVGQVIVSNAAALHLWLPNGTVITNDLVLSGDGISHPYAFINGKGALENIAGNSFWGNNNVDGIGDITLAGQSGIGVESIFGSSSLTIRTTIGGTTPASGIDKFGSQLLTLEGDGTYQGPVNIKEGVLLDRNNTGLGWSSSGTLLSQQTYAQTNTTVSSGAVLETQGGIANNNGGIASGIEVWNEKLILNAAAQQIAVAGDPNNAFALFTLSYTSPVTSVTSTTTPIHITATAQNVQDALNALPLAADNETASVTRTGNVFTIVFGTALSLDVPPLGITIVPPPPGFSSAEARQTNGN